MQFRCLLSLSTLTKLAGAAALFGGFDPRAATSMLLTIAVLGYHMTQSHAHALMKYCQVDQSRIDLSALLHILIPGVLLILLGGATTVDDSSFRTTVMCGAVYVALMLVGVTSSYGLGATDLLHYGAAYVLMNDYILYSFRTNPPLRIR